jgi:hypothetical protein
MAANEASNPNLKSQKEKLMALRAALNGQITTKPDDITLSSRHFWHDLLTSSAL